MVRWRSAAFLASLVLVLLWLWAILIVSHPKRLLNAPPEEYRSHSGKPERNEGSVNVAQQSPSSLPTEEQTNGGRTQAAASEQLELVLQQLEKEIADRLQDSYRSEGLQVVVLAPAVDWDWIWWVQRCPPSREKLLSLGQASIPAIVRRLTQGATSEDFAVECVRILDTIVSKENFIASGDAWHWGALPALKAGMLDPRERVRLAAANALSSCGARGRRAKRNKCTLGLRPTSALRSSALKRFPSIRTLSFGGVNRLRGCKTPS